MYLLDDITPVIVHFFVRLIFFNQLFPRNKLSNYCVFGTIFKAGFEIIPRCLS